MGDEHGWSACAGRDDASALSGYDPDKYLVLSNGKALDPETYFVLRSSDFAGRLGLRAYIEGVLLILDVTPLTTDEKQHLVTLADELSALADRWDRLGRLVPR